MKIVEMFQGVQGEGPIAGEPVNFIRFAGCNLRCSFCDTAYAQRENELLTETEVWHKLAWLQQWHNRAFVLTGGEPFLQEDAILRLYAQIDPMVDMWFETNGTILPKDYHVLDRDWTQVVASPKPQRTSIEVLQALAKVTHLYLKFVIGEQAWSVEDALDIANQVRAGGNYSVHDDTYLMPEGDTREKQLARMPPVIDACIKHGVKFSPRIHTLAFDRKRGV